MTRRESSPQWTLFEVEPDHDVPDSKEEAVTVEVLEHVSQYYARREDGTNLAAEYMARKIADLSDEDALNILVDAYSRASR